jgi:hypothetical protein
MARLGAFDREIAVATAGLTSVEVSKLLAATARKVLAEVKAKQPGSHRTFVNGREGASEDTVQAPGPIVYEFELGPEIVAFALDTLRALSPVKSGAYRDAHFLLVDGAAAPASAAVLGADLLIANDRPYARKIHVGAMKNMKVPPGIYERARQAVMARWGNAVRVEVTFVSLAGGYVAKGGALTYPALRIVPR